MDDFKCRIQIFNKVTGKTYEISNNEVIILEKLDGTNDITDLSREFDIPELEVKKFIDICSKIGVVGESKKKKINITKIKVAIFNPNKIISKNNFVWKLLNFTNTFLSVPIFIISIILSSNKINSIQNQITNFSVDINIIMYLFFIFLSLCIHEFFHAISARTSGANVPEIGLMLYWFMPCAYTNLTGLHFLEDKKLKMKALTAGLQSNLMISGIMLIIYNINLSPVYLFVGIINMLIIFMNLLCFIKLDGYYILSLCLDDPNLYENSQKIFKEKLVITANKIKNVKIKKTYKVMINERNINVIEELFLFVYGGLTCLYIPVLLVSMVYNIIF